MPVADHNFMKTFAKWFDWWLVTLSFVAFLAVEYAIIYSLLVFFRVVS